MWGRGEKGQWMPRDPCTFFLHRQTDRTWSPMAKFGASLFQSPIFNERACGVPPNTTAPLLFLTTTVPDYHALALSLAIHSF